MPNWFEHCHAVGNSRRNMVSRFVAAVKAVENPVLILVVVEYGLEVDLIIFKQY